MAFQGLFTSCGPLLFMNSNNYLKLKLCTVSIPFPRTHMALTHSLQSKVDALFFKRFTFWLCVLGNVLWLGMVALIQMENMFPWSWLHNIYGPIQYTSNNRNREIQLGFKTNHQRKWIDSIKHGGRCEELTAFSSDSRMTTCRLYFPLTPGEMAIPPYGSCTHEWPADRRNSAQMETYGQSAAT